MPDLSSIRFLLTDVDDTLTTQGRLLPETLQAIYSLHEAGIKVIPVTGGCAGWCDQMVRTWPVDAVIGENGAFYFTLDEKKRICQTSWHSEQEMKEKQKHLLEIATSILHTHPEVKLARDQAFRLADVAIDYNQDITGVSARQVQSIIDIFQQHGANARASSIHVNAWFGNYSKRAMSERLLKQVYGITEAEILSCAAYVGDAPNDEPMFSWLKYTFGVSNINRHLEGMSYHPAHILSQECGRGFAELSGLILQSR